VRRSLKITSIAAALAVLCVVIALVSAYKASQCVPEFYRAAVAATPESQRPACDAFVAEATALAGDLSGEGRWHSLFTADQINAWLAIELVKSYPDLLPAELREPRITIHGGEATIGCRYQHGDLEAVLSLRVEAYLHEPNVVALRIRHARAGALPIPLTQILDSISHAARHLNLELEWRRSHGDPVALVTLPQPSDPRSAGLRLESLELREGELFVAGTSGHPRPDASPIVAEPLLVPTAENERPAGDQPLVGSAEKDTRQK
jgi:hypothetical protein